MSSSEPVRRGIPTKLDGVQFRSRLEAKWAELFNMLGFKWVYEPFDLDGYIPDFGLRLHREVIVEVKPDMSFFGLHSHRDKIEKSGWNGDALIVGSFVEKEIYAPGWHNAGQEFIGLIGRRIAKKGRWDWNRALVNKCDMHIIADIDGVKHGSWGEEDEQHWGICSEDNVFFDDTNTSGHECLVCGRRQDSPFFAWNWNHGVKGMFAEAGNAVQWRRE
jgi:hypothetical protein